MTAPGGEIWQLRRDKNGVWGGRLVGTGKEEGKRPEKKKGLNYCLLRSARRDEELGSLAVCDLLSEMLYTKQNKFQKTFINGVKV